jgi:probable phosphoglycerate mutase
MPMNVYLVRHGLTEDHGVRLSGRAAGIHLTPEGQREAAEVAAALADERLAIVYTSPLERARETAGPIAARAGCRLRVWRLLTEIDFGAWTGSSYAALDGQPAWITFNRRPSRARIPGGETTRAVAVRAARVVVAVTSRHAGANVALVSHGDLLRLMVAGLLGMPIDAFRRVQIDEGSVTHVRIDDDGAASIVHLNVPSGVDGVSPRIST